MKTDYTRGSIIQNTRTKVFWRVRKYRLEGFYEVEACVDGTLGVIHEDDSVLVAKMPYHVSAEIERRFGPDAVFRAFYFGPKDDWGIDTQDGRIEFTEKWWLEGGGQHGPQEGV